MKVLLLLPVLSITIFGSSCRTVTPIDPMTGKQSCRCLPEYFRPDGSCCRHLVIGSK